MSSLVQDVCKPNSSTIWEDKQYGIRSNKAFECYAHQGSSTINFTYVIGLISTLRASYRSLISCFSAFPQFDDSSIIGRTQSLGLVIFFHGLQELPSIWNEHAKLLKKFPPIDVYLPEVPNNAHCDFKNLRLQCLVERIIEWTKRNPLKPIALFGQSTGSRLSMYVECVLREKAPKTPVHVSLMNGLLFGSKIAQPGSKETSNSTSDDLKFGSASSKELLTLARLPLSEKMNLRDYHMYANQDVHSLGSALPIINPDKQLKKSENHYLLRGYDHMSEIIEKQIEDCVEFIVNQQPENLSY